MNFETKNAKLVASFGISKVEDKQMEAVGVSVWYVSGGKTFCTSDDENLTPRDILIRYSEARFEEGKDDIRSELKDLLDIK